MKHGQILEKLYWMKEARHQRTYPELFHFYKIQMVVKVGTAVTFGDLARGKSWPYKDIRMSLLVPKMFCIVIQLVAKETYTYAKIHSAVSLEMGVKPQCKLFSK